MAEFVFHGDTADSSAIAAGILADPSMRLLRAWEYPTRKAEEIERDLSNFVASIKANKGMYVAGPFTAKIPWRKVVDPEEDGTWRIYEFCGDLISIRFPGMSTKSGAKVFNPGSVHIQSQYLTRDFRSVMPPSDALRAGYQQVVKVARKCCVKVRYLDRPYWIGAHLLARSRDEADVTVRVSGKNVPVQDLVIE